MLFGITTAGLRFQIVTLKPTARASSNVTSTVVLGFRRTHLRVCVKNPLRFARIGSCFSQCSKSSASAKAEEYRPFGSFSRHFRQIVLRSRSIFGFKTRGCRGSVSSNSLIVSYVVPPAKGG